MGLFFNIRKPRKFDHKPIYFDPDKEALEKRVEKIKRELGMDDAEPYRRSEIKGTFLEQTKHLKRRNATPEKSTKDRNIKLAVILVCLIIVLWFLFTGIDWLF